MKVNEHFCLMNAVNKITFKLMSDAGDLYMEKLRESPKVAFT